MYRIKRGKEVTGTQAGRIDVSVVIEPTVPGCATRRNVVKLTDTITTGLTCCITFIHLESQGPSYLVLVIPRSFTLPAPRESTPSSSPTQPTISSQTETSLPPRCQSPTLRQKLPRAMRRMNSLPRRLLGAREWGNTALRIVPHVRQSATARRRHADIFGSDRASSDRGNN